MRKSQFSDEKILAIVKEGESGRKVADLVRTYGITEQTQASLFQEKARPPMDAGEVCGFIGGLEYLGRLMIRERGVFEAGGSFGRCEFFVRVKERKQYSRRRPKRAYGHGRGLVLRASEPKVSNRLAVC